MKFGVMFPDISASLLKRPATEKYPFERQEVPARLRSFLEWQREACTGCGLCTLDCPARAIQVSTLDRKAKRFVFTYHVDRCTFCSQCVESCRQGALSMVNDHWELAALTREPFLIHMGEPEDVQIVLAGTPALETEKNPVKE